MMLLENDLSNPGVRMVRFAGFRRLVLGGMIGDGGAERWCWEVVSNKDAVAMGGRESKAGGILNDRFLRLRARREGDSWFVGLGASVDGSKGPCCCCCCSFIPAGEG